MTSEPPGSNRFTIGALLRSGIIIAHKDGNYGSLYPRVSDFGLIGVPFITAKSLTDGRIDIAGAPRLAFDKAKKLTYGFVRPGDVLLSHNATIGRVAVMPDFDGEILVGTSLTYYRVDQTKLIPLYLAAFFSSVDFQNQLKAVMGLSTRNQVPITAQRKLNVVVPPIENQRYIADTLGTLDDRISMLREINTTLEAIAQALFKSWFVDFDPVRAKAEGLEPEGMDAATAALFPDSFEELELGLLPSGWRCGVLGDVADTTRKQIQPSAMKAETLYVGLEHIPRQSLGLDSWASTDGLESAKSCFEKGDILFGKLRPYFHKIVIAPFAGVCSTDILVCNAKVADYYGFVAMQLFSTELVAYADRLSNGAKMPRVNWKDLSDYALVIPPVEVAAEYSDVVHPLFEQITANVHEAKTLGQLRDTLLPRLISGQLRLPEAEAQLEAVCA
ncbi:restriction endonuclease subunit S [Pseudomonas syringae group genomosp. 3]|uniref:restriction endonuclease subunit S n=1 Tax=Pseudomonas syringae group genomosp. 3 TaxID=251701 RepID=UPI000EFF8AE1|nr:restriction endonuclease subunit S [Pseudomonas syringae group genomosp. 3]MBM0210506.1 restriction endonuclease subunit S [Pseudomonas syringae pv. maculicola]